MRYLVLSDIHGSSEELAQALSFFDKLNCDVIVLLGDLLNHGPRNRLPDSYEPPKVAELLNAHKEHIISIRGNCDSEVDGMVFSFPCNAAYGWILVPRKNSLVRVFLTHGHLHKYDTIEEACKLGLKEGDIVLSGHTHVSGIFKKESGVINVNPGSTALPKGGTVKSFGFIDENFIKVFDLQGKELLSLSFDELLCNKC